MSSAMAWRGLPRRGPPSPTRSGQACAQGATRLAGTPGRGCLLQHVLGTQCGDLRHQVRMHCYLHGVPGPRLLPGTPQIRRKTPGPTSGGCPIYACWAVLDAQLAGKPAKRSPASQLSQLSQTGRARLAARVRIPTRTRFPLVLVDVAVIGRAPCRGGADRQLRRLPECLDVRSGGPGQAS
jgi:hypothetical protein